MCLERSMDDISEDSPRRHFLLFEKAEEGAADDARWACDDKCDASQARAGIHHRQRSPGTPWALPGG
jgi:hypothetical protein